MVEPSSPVASASIAAAVGAINHNDGGGHVAPRPHQHHHQHVPLVSASHDSSSASNLLAAHMIDAGLASIRRDDAPLLPHGHIGLSINPSDDVLVARSPESPASPSSVVSHVVHHTPLPPMTPAGPHQLHYDPNTGMMVSVPPVGAAASSLQPPLRISVGQSNQGGTPLGPPGSAGGNGGAGTGVTPQTPHSSGGTIRATFSAGRPTTAEEKDDQDRGQITGKDELSRLKMHRFVHPHHRRHRYWILVLLLAAVINATTVPWRLAFGYYQLSESFDYLFLLDGACDIMFILDIALNTRLAYFEEGTLVTDPTKIWRRYRSQYFPLDVIAVLPIDWIVLACGYPVQAKLCRLIRILQLAHLRRYIRELESQPGVNITLARIVKLICYIFLLSHLVGCAWFSFSHTAPFGSDDWLPFAELENIPRMSQYLFSCYWALAMMTGNFNDNVPHTTGQFVFTIGTLMFGLLSFAYIIGNVQFAAQQSSESLGQFRDRVSYVKRWMQTQNIPEAMQQKVVHFYLYKWSQTKGFDDEQILKGLPGPLLSDVTLSLSSSTIGKVELFKGLEKCFISALVNRMGKRVFIPGEFLCHQGDEGDEMYFIRKGKVEILIGIDKDDPSKQKIVRNLNGGDSMGELSLLLKAPRSATARAVSYTDVFVLTKDNLDEVMGYYPDAAKEIQARTEKKRQAMIQNDQKAVAEPNSAGSNSSTTPGPLSLLSSGSNGGIDSIRAGSMIAAAPPVFFKQQSLSVPPIGVASPILSYHRTISTLPPTPAVHTGDIDPNVIPFKPRCGNWMLDSNGDFYTYWSSLLLVVTMYNAVMVPFRCAFVPDLDYWLVLVCDYVGDAFLIANIIVNWHLQMSRRGEPETLEQVQERYGKKWFWFDLLTCLPLDIVMAGIGMEPRLRLGRIVRVFSESHLLTVRKVQKASANFEVWEIFKLIAGFLLLSHFGACFYWGVYVKGENYGNDDNNSWLPEPALAAYGTTAYYFRSYYQAMTILTSLGQANTPFVETQILYNSLLVLIGSLVVAWIIGQFTSLIQNLNRYTAEYGHKMFVTNQFMQYRNIPAPIQTRVRKFLAHQWNTRKGVDIQTALEGLPEGLRDEIMFHICAGSVAKVPLFQSQMALDKHFLHRVIHMLTFESFPAGEYVFHKGEIGDCMYLISQGEVGIILDEDNPVPVKIIGQGDFFGEGALITLSTRTASILARTSCYLMCLSRENFGRLMEMHPAFAAEMRRLAHQRAGRIDKRRKSLNKKKSMTPLSRVKTKTLLDDSSSDDERDKKKKGGLRWGRNKRKNHSKDHPSIMGLAELAGMALDQKRAEDAKIAATPRGAQVTPLTTPHHASTPPHGTPTAAGTANVTPVAAGMVPDRPPSSAGRRSITNGSGGGRRASRVATDGDQPIPDHLVRVMSSPAILPGPQGRRSMSQPPVIAHWRPSMMLNADGSVSRPPPSPSGQGHINGEESSTTDDDDDPSDNDNDSKHQSSQPPSRRASHVQIDIKSHGGHPHREATHADAVAQLHSLQVAALPSPVASKPTKKPRSQFFSNLMARFGGSRRNLNSPSKQPVPTTAAPSAKKSSIKKPPTPSSATGGEPSLPRVLSVVAEEPKLGAAPSLPPPDPATLIPNDHGVSFAPVSVELSSPRDWGSSQSISQVPPSLPPPSLPPFTLPVAASLPPPSLPAPNPISFVTHTSSNQSGGVGVGDTTSPSTVRASPQQSNEELALLSSNHHRSSSDLDIPTISLARQASSDAVTNVANALATNTTNDGNGNVSTLAPVPAAAAVAANDGKSVPSHERVPSKAGMSGISLGVHARVPSATSQPVSLTAPPTHMRTSSSPSSSSPIVMGETVPPTLPPIDASLLVPSSMMTIPPTLPPAEHHSLDSRHSHTSSTGTSVDSQHNDHHRQPSGNGSNDTRGSGSGKPSPNISAMMMMSSIAPPLPAVDLLADDEPIARDSRLGITLPLSSSTPTSAATAATTGNASGVISPSGPPPPLPTFPLSRPSVLNTAAPPPPVPQLPPHQYSRASQ